MTRTATTRTRSISSRARSFDADPELLALVTRAEDLIGKPDPKLTALVDALTPLIKKGANPVVFCRYLATAEHVRDGLRKAFPKLTVEAVTGVLTPDERRDRVADMAPADEEKQVQRILVATDCLSEGINLQQLFDTVVHYDLSWNPTRHQQREGRVDRFGQPAELVRSIMMFSPDSAIDGAVLDVILRKAEEIRKATGVTVPLPDERGPVTDALMASMMLRRGVPRQLTLDLRLDDGAKAMEARWRDAEENEKKSRARFAQNAMKPQEVAPEWEKVARRCSALPRMRGCSSSGRWRASACRLKPGKPCSWPMSMRWTPACASVWPSTI